MSFLFKIYQCNEGSERHQAKKPKTKDKEKCSALSARISETSLNVVLKIL